MSIHMTSDSRAVSTLNLDQDMGFQQVLGEVMPAASMAKRRRTSTLTREKLLKATEDLLEQQGANFSLPDVARLSGLATATVYRHFKDTQEILTAYNDARIGKLVSVLRSLEKSISGFSLFQSICHEWVKYTMPAVRSATHFRSPEGFLERVKNNDPDMTAIADVFGGALKRMIADGIIPEQDLNYGVLIWITLLDERLLVDLSATLGWSDSRIAAVVAQHVLTVLRTPVPESLL